MRRAIQIDVFTFFYFLANICPVGDDCGCCFVITVKSVMCLCITVPDPTSHEQQAGPFGPPCVGCEGEIICYKVNSVTVTITALLI